MREFWMVMCLAVVAACPAAKHTIDAVGSSQTCPGALMVVEDGADHSASSNAQVVSETGLASGSKLFVVGPAKAGSGGGFGMLTGYIKITGFMPNQSVQVQLVTAPVCGTTGCSTTISLTIGNVDVFSTSGMCGTATVTADSTGALVIFSDPAGTNGDNNGVLITIP